MIMTTANVSNNMVVFAGGYDLEMVKIIAIARECGVEVVDKFLGWGESSAVHAEAIAEALSNNREVVMIEPIFSDEYPQPAGVTVIDHHGENCHRPASIVQFCELIGYPMSREIELIGANDAGYIPAMMALGASEEEVASIRRMDREAQGITEEQEAIAAEAVNNLQVVNGVTVVRMSHSKTATISDRIFDASKPQNLLILSEDGETNYYGPTELCSKLEEVMKGFGASYAYSGQTYAGGNPDQQKIYDYVVNYFAK